MKLWFREYFDINYWSVALTDHWLTESHDFIIRCLDGRLDGCFCNALSNEKKESKENTEITFPSTSVFQDQKTSWLGTKVKFKMTENYISNLNIESQRKVEPEVKVDTRPSQLRWLGVSRLYSVTVFDSAIPWLHYTAGCEKLTKLQCNSRHWRHTN